MPLTLEKMKKLERFSMVNGPLMILFNQRWYGAKEDDPEYLKAVEKTQGIYQAVLDCIEAGLL